MIFIMKMFNLQSIHNSDVASESSSLKTGLTFDSLLKSLPRSSSYDAGCTPQVIKL